MTTLILPWPPSLNRYYRSVGGRVLISAAGRTYRADVAKAIATARLAGTCGQAPISGRVAITMVTTQPDRRRRDLDNVQKALLDALTHAGVWDDDSQVDDLRIVRGPVAPGEAAMAVRITPLAAEVPALKRKVA